MDDAIIEELRNIEARLSESDRRITLILNDIREIEFRLTDKFGEPTECEACWRERLEKQEEEWK